MRSRPGILLQARMASTRLPGKALELVAGRPVLEHCLRRAAQLRTEFRDDDGTVHQNRVLADEVKKLFVGPLDVTETERRIRRSPLAQQVAYGNAHRRNQLTQFVRAWRRLQVFDDFRFHTGVAQDGHHIA